MGSKCLIVFIIILDPVQDRVRERAQAAAARQARKGAKDQFLGQVMTFPEINMVILKNISYIFLRIDFVAEKSRLGGGKKRSVHFSRGQSDKEVVSAPG